MSSPDLKVYTTGKLICHIFTFVNLGDEIPEHEHEEADNHITIVRKGPVKVFGDGWSEIHQTGAFLDWEVGQRHGIMGMEAGTSVINILKNT